MYIHISKIIDIIKWFQIISRKIPYFLYHMTFDNSRYDTVVIEMTSKRRGHLGVYENAIIRQNHLTTYCGHRTAFHFVSCSLITRKQDMRQSNMLTHWDRPKGVSQGLNLCPPWLWFAPPRIAYYGRQWNRVANSQYIWAETVRRCEITVSPQNVDVVSLTGGV